MYFLGVVSVLFVGYDELLVALDFTSGVSDQVSLLGWHFHATET